MLGIFFLMLTAQPDAGAADDEKIEMAIHALSSEHLQDVVQANLFLKKSGARGNALLIRALDRHQGNQPAIAQLLGTLGREDSVAVLHEASVRGAGHQLGWDAVSGLGLHPSPKALQALISLSTSKDPAVRESVPWGLRVRPEKVARAALKAMLKDPESSVSGAARRALEGLK